MEIFFEDYADTVSNLFDSQLNNFFHNFRDLYMINNKEMIDLFFSKRGGCRLWTTDSSLQ